VSQPKTYGAEELFNKWVGSLIDNPEMRYLGVERQGFVQRLITMFYANNIEQEDAAMYKRKVVDALTTPEGRKGKGRYKGWKETVEESFTANLANVYVADLTEQQLQNAQGNMVKIRDGKQAVSATITPVFTIPVDNRIVEWVRKSYGDNANIMSETHRVGSLMNIEFLQANYF